MRNRLTTVLALLLPAATAAGMVVAAPASAPAADTSTERPAGLEPLVLAHRGASGYRPEHTAGAYELAVAMGADYIEPDLVMTKDGVLVDRHEPEISETTDVAAHPEFAGRRTTKQVDGRAVTGWFAEDFTLAELKTLRAKERLPQLRQENTIYDGRWTVPTFDEVLEQRDKLSRTYHRTIGIIPEIKHSTYLHELGFDPEAAVVAALRKHGMSRANAPVWVQSFELGNLQRMRTELRFPGKLVFLATNGGAPYDLVQAGDPRTYADLLTATSLRELAKTINGVGPDKGLVVRRNADGTLGSPTTLVADAHAAGLQVMPWTLRAENYFLPVDYRIGANPADFGRVIDEAKAFIRAGVDGLFCDQPDVCVTARADILADG